MVMEECNLLLIYGGDNKPSWTLVTCDGLQPGCSRPGGRSSARTLLAAGDLVAAGWHQSCSSVAWEGEGGLRLVRSWGGGGSKVEEPWVGRRRGGRQRLSGHHPPPRRGQSRYYHRCQSYQSAGPKAICLSQTYHISVALSSFQGFPWPAICREGPGTKSIRDKETADTIGQLRILLQSLQINIQLRLFLAEDEKALMV